MSKTKFDAQYFRNKAHQNHIITKQLSVMYKTDSESHESFTQFTLRMKTEKPELFQVDD